MTPKNGRRKLGSRRVQQGKELDRARSAFREELATEIVFPVVMQDMPGASRAEVRKRAFFLLDRAVEHFAYLITPRPRQETPDGIRARKALAKLRAALERFNAEAESLARAGRNGAGWRGPEVSGVETVHFLTNRLLDKRPGEDETEEAINLLKQRHGVDSKRKPPAREVRALFESRPPPGVPDPHRWNAARHALAPHRGLSMRELFVLDCDKPGILRATRDQDHLSFRHLAMLSVLAGNSPKVSAGMTTEEVVKREANSLRAVAWKFGVDSVPRMTTEASKRRFDNLRTSPTAPARVRRRRIPRVG